MHAGLKPFTAHLRLLQHCESLITNMKQKAFKKRTENFQNSVKTLDPHTQEAQQRLQTHEE